MTQLIDLDAVVLDLKNEGIATKQFTDYVDVEINADLHVRIFENGEMQTVHSMDAGQTADLDKSDAFTLMTIMNIWHNSQMMN